MPRSHAEAMAIAPSVVTMFRQRLLSVVERLLSEGESYAEISVERLVSEAGLFALDLLRLLRGQRRLLRAWFTQVILELEERPRDGGSSTALPLSPTSMPPRQIVRSYRPHTTLMAALVRHLLLRRDRGEEVAMMMGRNGAACSVTCSEAGGGLDRSRPDPRRHVLA